MKFVAMIDFLFKADSSYFVAKKRNLHLRYFKGWL